MAFPTPKNQFFCGSRWSTLRRLWIHSYFLFSTYLGKAIHLLPAHAACACCLRMLPAHAACTCACTCKLPIGIQDMAHELFFREGSWMLRRIWIHPYFLFLTHFGKVVQIQQTSLPGDFPWSWGLKTTALTSAKSPYYCRNGFSVIIRFQNRLYFLFSTYFGKVVANLANLSPWWLSRHGPWAWAL